MGGGGVKGFLSDVKKTARLLNWGIPKSWRCCQPESVYVSGTDLERRMVRKVNILVPIYDDSCFNYCGRGVDRGIYCKRNFCKALGEY